MAPTPVASGKFIVVFGTKGGVGKTVVATNLAAALALRIRKPVCLIDLDVMAVGDVGKAMSLSPVRSIADVLHDTPLPSGANGGAAGAPLLPSLEGVAVRHPSGVDLLTCVTDPRQLHGLDLKSLGRFFEALKSRYDYIIVDCGKAISDPLITAFDAANLILLITTPDVITLYQTKWAASMLERLLLPASLAKAVLNRAESRGSIGTQDVRSAIPCELIGQIPSDGRVVGTAMNQGVPVVTDFANTRVAESFMRLAELLTLRGNLFVAHRDVERQRRGDDVAALAKSSSGLTARLFEAPADATPVTQAIDQVSAMKARIHTRLVQELDLKRLDVGALTNANRLSELRQKVEPVIASLLVKEMGGILSSREDRERLVKEIADEALGYGPLEELLADQTVTDILVNNKDQVYVERAGKLELTTKRFVSNEQVRTIIERIVAPLGRHIDEANPMVDARLPDGSRVNAIVSPLSVKGPVLSIRKFSRRRFGIEDLIRLSSMSPAMSQLIHAAVLCRKNIIISGGTGSGKTTMLNVISSYIPATERIITIEDAAELKLDQTHWVSLESRPPNIEGKGTITIRDLFRNALRMRPDRVIIGECRQEETLDMLQAMNTGHDGSMTTVHANTPRDVISRMDSMVLMSNVDLPVRAIREMVFAAIDLVIQTARMSDGSRKIVSVSELVDLVNETEIVFQDLFSFQQTGVAPDGTVLGDFVPTGKLPSFFDEARIKGIPLDEHIFHKPSAVHS